MAQALSVTHDDPVPIALPAWGPAMALFWVAATWLFSIFVVFGLECSGLLNVSLADGSADVYMLQLTSVPIHMLCLLVVASRLQSNPFDVLGLRAPEQLGVFIKTSLKLVAGTLTVCAIIAVIYTLCTDTDIPTNSNQELLEAAMRRTPLSQTVLSTCILAPVVEEMVFRGLLLQSFRGTRLWFWGAAVVTSLLFALVHVVTANPFMLAPYFLTGLACAWGFRITGSLWVSIGIHSLKNAVAVMVILIST